MSNNTNKSGEIRKSFAGLPRLLEENKTPHVPQQNVPTTNPIPPSGSAEENQSSANNDKVSKK